MYSLVIRHKKLGGGVEQKETPKSYCKTVFMMRKGCSMK